MRSPHRDKVSAPRQSAAARDVVGTIELDPAPGMEHAVCDLDGCTHLWVLFWFHEAHDFRPKVLPPRSPNKRRGVLATRSPHRPNPIGMSVVRLDRVDGLTLHIRDIDMLDGTPVLDVKPYVPYADSVPGARVAWLEEADAAEVVADGAAPRDPRAGFTVTFEPAAARVIAYLKETHGLDLQTPIVAVLSLGPQPHPYRRIKKVAGGFLLAVKDWRARFMPDGRTVRVTSIETGYRPSQLLGDAGKANPSLAPHRAVWEGAPARSGSDDGGA